MQFAEGPSDAQAADAGYPRAGRDASVLVEFRARLIAGEAELLLLDTLLAWCRER